MSPRLLLAALPLLVVVAGSVGADEPLGWRFETGHTLAFRSVQESTSVVKSTHGETESATRQTADLNWRVVDVAADGSAMIEQEIIRFQLQFDAPGGQGYAFDSRQESAPEGLAALVAPLYRTLVERPIRFRLSPTGAVSELMPPEDLARELESTPDGETLGGPAGLYRSLLCPILLNAPAGQLAVGQTWTVDTDAASPAVLLQTARLIYEYRGDRDATGDGLAAIRVRLEITAPDAQEPAGKSVALDVVESEGEVLFDRRRGRVRSGRLETTIEFRAPLGADPVSGTVKQSSTIESVEPATDSP